MDIKQFYTSLEAKSRRYLLLGVGSVLLLTLVAFWWLLRPDQQLLFGNLRERDAAEITQSLTEWKIPYVMSDGGRSIKVAADKVYDTRMRLVAAGVPKGGHAGFELFDNADFGVTEFAQRVNFQRALQGEIERTISSLPGVENARVHLTIRKPGLFVGDKESSKASVALAMNPGMSLEAQQLDGIKSLVAAAVEGLSPAQVSVIDTNGRLLAAARLDDGVSPAALISDEASRLEASVQAKVEHVLSQFLVPDQYRVSVDATLDMDALHEVRDTPVRDGNASNDLMQRQRVSSTNTQGQNGHTESETEFALARTRTELSRQPGRIQRMTIAVALGSDASGVDLKGIRQLVYAAAGLSDERGDRLEIFRAHAPPSMAVKPASAAAGPVVPSGAVRSRGPWLLWSLFAMGGLILIMMVMAIRGRRTPRRLTANERDQVLSKVRDWLREGNPTV
ncbi:flagellar M-ring protein FliF [Lysobacter pythonis]|uniref:Flagellar M-ring protein n=1 Tax=Solilutibacter pythonis TaxID=2483112 RepID=A0A3M2I723_9GAMM|nr:flagellar basal-body MS-ring/collar protein FliF [Lysobacter pythonis]RMH94064.1 flagellar M-ring protein FliF [Lysobacter pythonis]